MAIELDKVLARYDAYWHRANDDRPLVYMFGPHNPAKVYKGEHHADHKEAWLDTEYQLKKHREYLSRTFYLGEGFPVFNPNLGPDVLGAVCGSNLQFGDHTSWAEPILEDYDSFPPIVFDENNFWWKKLEEMTAAALKDAKGDYLVGITDLHPGADGLVSLRGPQEAAIDLYDDPEGFQRVIWEQLPVFKEMTGRLHNMISAEQKASVNWMCVAHPNELWYPTCCDFSCMISGDAFEEFILPELVAEIDWLPNSIYHLDGPDALRHLDTLLQIEKLKGVQWVYGAGQPSARYWAETLQKIQNAGKCVAVYCQPEDLVPLCEVLDPQGVHFKCTVPSEQEGQWLLDEMERTCRQKQPKFFVK